MTWQVRRENHSDDNYWHRTQHDRGEDREFRVLVNGTQAYVPYPDGSAEYGDQGNPIGVLIHYDDHNGWNLYCYMFHGDAGRVEWVLKL